MPSRVTRDRHFSERTGGTLGTLALGAGAAVTGLVRGPELVATPLEGVRITAYSRVLWGRVAERWSSLIPT